MYNYVYVSLSDIHFGNAKVADELMSAGTQVVGLGIRRSNKGISGFRSNCVDEADDEFIK